MKKLKIPNHDQYITTNDCSKFSGAIFDERLKQAKLTTKTDIAVFITKTYFDGKLKNINKKVTSNKKKHLEADMKLTNLSKKVSQRSIKGYDILVGIMYHTGDNVYQFFFHQSLIR